MAKKQHIEEELVYTKYEKARMIGSRALQLSMECAFPDKIKSGRISQDALQSFRDCFTGIRTRCFTYHYKKA